MNARLITTMNCTKDGEKEMFDIYKTIDRISYFCKGRMCYECPFRYEAECNIVTLAEALSGDPCMWDMKWIKEVLNREVDSNN